MRLFWFVAPLLFWAIALVSGHTFRGWVHVLLVLSVVNLIYQLVATSPAIVARDEIADETQNPTCLVDFSN